MIGSVDGRSSAASSPTTRNPHHRTSNAVAVFSTSTGRKSCAVAWQVRPADGWRLVLTRACVSCNLRFMPTYQPGDGWELLADPTRRAIVERLANKPCAVGELAEAFPISRPAVSQHLKILKGAGLITDQAAGNRRVYRLNPAGVAALRDQLDTFWNRTLAGYQDGVDEAIEEE